MLPLQYLWQAGVPLTLFIVVVTTLLYYWPRPPEVLLNRKKQRVQIIEVKQLSPDTKRIRASLGGKELVLGLSPGKHIVVYASNPQKCLSGGLWNGKEDADNNVAEITRPYTPVTGDDAKGYFDILVKIYRPGNVKMADGKEILWEDGGKMGAYLDSKQPGDYIEINGPFGHIEYLGQGMFKMPNKTVSVDHVGMLAGGSGITAMFQMLKVSLRDSRDRCRFSLLYANKTEEDILLRDELEQMVKDSAGRVQVNYTLDFPPPKWKHRAGNTNPEMIRNFMPRPSEKPLLLVCGPPPMVDSCQQHLGTLGYKSPSIFVL